ncbi:MAG: aminotransferase class I/II-fold pyridoxal phosphate-dependent enzyme [Granulosicoccus sp.]
MKFRPEIGESLTLKFAEAAAVRRKAGLPIYSLGLGEPDFSTPPALIDSVTEVLQEGNSTYSAALGVPQLRERIAEKFQKDNGVIVSTGNILVAAGAKQALSIVLMALLEPGDEVVVLSPAFVSFIPQIYLAEPDTVVKVVRVDPTTHELPMDELSSAVTARTRAIILNTPNNPAGFVCSPAELASLMALAEQYNCTIIADEVYEKLVFPGAKHNSIGALEAKPDRVCTINGFSKSHALTGWRIGYVTLPDTLVSRVIKIQQHMNTNTCTFVQQALARSWDLECPHIDPYLQQLVARVKLIESWLGKNTAVTARLPKAGFFTFVNISGLGVSSNTFCAELLEKTGVATTPGIAFGQDWDDHFRLSYAVEQSVLEDALERISNHLNTYL